jgi:iron complex transport system ATP-binding protein
MQGHSRAPAIGNLFMASILQVTGLGITRDGTRILDDISWSVRKGEHWVILGANGSGKTSLLSALTGYLTPTTGEVEVLGQRYGSSDWRELRRAIGIVSSSIRQMMHDEEPALDSVISGKFAMIDFWGKSTPRDRAQAMRILRQIECGHLAARPWRVLSQGERQRILIGRALMARPRLLILDEPCAGLDPVSREHFLQFIQRLGERRDSPALILVTHHVEEIVPVFSHVLLLKAGRVLGLGPRESVLASGPLGETFGAKIRLGRSGGRYRLMINSRSSAVC